MGREEGLFRRKLLGTMLFAFLMLFLFGPVTAKVFHDSTLLGSEALLPFKQYLTLNLPFLLCFLALWFSSEVVLKLPLSTVISKERKPQIASLLLASGIVFLVQGVFDLCSFRAITYNRIPFSTRAIALLPVLLLTPLQALSEEMLFRVLPSRLCFGWKLRGRWLPRLLFILASSTLFMLLHLSNKEVSASEEPILTASYYLLFALLAASYGFLEEGFWIPIAIHSAINLYLVLFVNLKDSSLSGISLFLYTKEIPAISSLAELLLCFLLLWLFAGRRKAQKDLNHGKKAN